MAAVVRYCWRLGQRTGQDCEDKGDCAKDEKIADKRSVIGGAEDRLDRQLHAYPEKTCPSRTNGARSQSFPVNRSPASSLTRSAARAIVTVALKTP
jgi:hypothetical protein